MLRKCRNTHFARINLSCKYIIRKYLHLTIRCHHQYQVQAFSLSLSFGGFLSFLGMLRTFWFSIYNKMHFLCVCVCKCFHFTTCVLQLFVSAPLSHVTIITKCRHTRLIVGISITRWFTHLQVHIAHLHIAYTPTHPQNTVYVYIFNGKMVSECLCSFSFTATNT